MQTMTDGTVATDETTVGTASYHLQSEHLGSVHSLVVDKISGQIAWAVTSFGLYRYQQSYHLLPWRVLKDDVRQGSYPTELDQRRLEESPSYSSSNLSNQFDRPYGHRSIITRYEVLRL